MRAEPLAQIERATQFRVAPLQSQKSVKQGSELTIVYRTDELMPMLFCGADEAPVGFRARRPCQRQSSPFPEGLEQ